MVRKVSEHDRMYHRELIWMNSLDLFNRRSILNPDQIIKMQTRYINSFNMFTKNKYKTVECLKQALYTKDRCKSLADEIFVNTANRKIMHSV